MTALVGRSAERESIAELIRASTAESAALMIEGAAGIGKTALWLEAVHHARRQGTRVLSAHGSAAESVLAYSGLADLLADVEVASWAGLPAPQRRGLAAALLDEVPADTASVDPRAVGAAFLTVVRRLVDESPVVVAFDDLQWMDRSSAAAVAFAARRLPRGVTWLCTVRDDEGPPSTGWFELSPPAAVHRVSLAPLTMSELDEVLVTRCGRPITRATMLRIHQLSDGNPFYATELALEMLRHGGGPEFPLPQSLAELTDARIRRFDGEAAPALLAVASLANPTIRAVAAAVESTPARLLGILADAESEGVVTVVGNQIRYSHPLLAHAVTVGATAADRRSMHRRLAEVVSEPELRARHLALADPAGEADTLTALDAAADIALARGAPTAAAEFVEWAITLGVPTHARRMLQARCLFDSGDPVQARVALESAIAESPPGMQRAESLHQLAVLHLQSDDFTDAAEACRRALIDCEEGSALRVGVTSMLALAQLNVGNLGVALELAEQAAAAANERGQSAQLDNALDNALGIRAVVRFMTGEGIDEARFELAGDFVDDPSLPLALRPDVQRALLRGWSGHPTEPRAALAAIAEQCEADGKEGEMLFLAFYLVLFDIWSGQLHRAEVTAREAMSRARQLGYGAALFMAESMQAAVAVHQGRVADARTHIDSAFAAAGVSGHLLMKMTWPITMQGLLELSVGNHAKALGIFEPLLPMMQAVPRYSEPLGANFVPDAVEAMVAVGRHAEAEPLIQTLEENGTRLDRPWMLAVGARCRALLLATQGDVSAGVDQARSALHHHDRLDMPFERARTLLVLGRLERRLRHWQPATTALNEALALFDAIGTPLWAAQVRSELQRGSSGRTRSPGLTPTEQRVADLAASGMTNQDIAATLFIARKTVEVNLSRIYRKLGVHSRVELLHLMQGARSRKVRSSGAVEPAD